MEASETMEATKWRRASGIDASTSMDKMPHSKRRDFFWNGKKSFDFINLFNDSMHSMRLAEEQATSDRFDFVEKRVRFAPVWEGFHFRGNFKNRWNETLNERNSIRREKQQRTALQKQGNRGIGEIVETPMHNFRGIGVP